MEFIASPDAATQLWAFDIFLGFWVPNAALNDRLFMQVIAAPVSNNHMWSGFRFWYLFLVWLFLQVQKFRTVCCRSSARPGIGLKSAESAPICYRSVVWHNSWVLRLVKLICESFPHQCIVSASIFCPCRPCRAGCLESGFCIHLAGD